MSYSVALTFRDNVVHRINCGDDLQVAQSVLQNVSSSLNTERYEFKNDADELIYVANVKNLMFAFIEETKPKGESE